MDSLKKVTKGKGNAVVPSESKNEKSKNVVNKNIKEGAKDKKNLPPKKQHEEEEDDDEEEEEDIEEDIEEEEEEGEENGDDDDVEGDQDDEEDDGEDGENGDDNEDDDDDDEEEDEDADSNPKKRKQSKVSLDANPNNKKQQGNTATLILLGFPFEATEEQLREFLAPCGKIHSLAISETRRGTAKAVIDRQSLEKGLELNKKYIGDRFVVVREYTDEPRSKSNDNDGSSESKVIFVGNLGSDADESEIRELFEECGEIKGIRLGKDRETGEFKGYAYVEFDNSEAPKKAMELNGNDFNGKSIKVDIDRKGPKKDGFGGGRGRGFGGRGGGRGFGGDRRGGGGFRGGRGFGGDRRGGGGRDFGGERRFGGDGERRGGGGFRGGRGFGGDRRGGGGGFRGGRGFGGDRRGGGGRDF